MRTLSMCLGLMVLLGAPSLALQSTPATAIVRVACSDPAPPMSLVGQPTTPLTYVPDSGNVVVMEMESHDPTSNWKEETSLAGFGGESYFRWDGPNLFNTPGVDTLNFTFEIKQADRYLIRIHARNDDPDPSMENDCWARLSTDPWEKLFNNSGPSSVGVWIYTSRYESTSFFPDYDLTPGTYTFQISGRSTNFKIDRIHVIPYDTWFAQLSDPQSDVQRSRPLLGSTISVEIDDPTDAEGFTPGVARTIWYGGNIGAGYPCGIGTKWGEVFLFAPSPIFQVGPEQIWNGPGQPNVHSAVLPTDPAMLGFTVITQGVMLQPGKVVVTDGLELTLGDI